MTRIHEFFFSSQCNDMIFVSSFMKMHPLFQEWRRCTNACQTAHERTQHTMCTMLWSLSWGQLQTAPKRYRYKDAWKIFFRLHVERRCRRNCRYATAYSEPVERLSLTAALNLHTIWVWVAGGMRHGCNKINIWICWQRTLTERVWWWWWWWSSSS
jgi:hypothetical protein